MKAAKQAGIAIENCHLLDKSGSVFPWDREEIISFAPRQEAFDETQVHFGVAQRPCGYQHPQKREPQKNP